MKKTISEFSQIILGIILTSIGLKAFLLPNGFLDGGLTGVALLGNALFGFNVSLLLVINFFKTNSKLLHESKLLCMFAVSIDIIDI